MPDSVLPATLSNDERRQLSRHIKTIRDGEGVFLAVGRALAEIRDKRLYRETHKTFRAFVEDELGYTRRYGDLLISGYQVAENVNEAVASKNENNCSLSDAAPALEIPPITRESQARVLRQAPKDAQPVIYEAAVRKNQGKPPTAKQLSDEVEAYQRKKPRPAPKPVDRPKPFQSERDTIAFLIEITPHISFNTSTLTNTLKDKLHIWGGAEGVRDALSTLLRRIEQGLSGSEHVALCPPTRDDVTRYAGAEGLPAEYAEDFLDHYEGNGWVAGGSLVINWRRKYSAWCRRQTSGAFTNNGRTNGRTNGKTNNDLGNGTFYGERSAENDARLARAAEDAAHNLRAEGLGR